MRIYAIWNDHTSFSFSAACNDVASDEFRRTYDNVRELPLGFLTLCKNLGMCIVSMWSGPIRKTLLLAPNQLFNNFTRGNHLFDCSPHALLFCRNHLLQRIAGKSVKARCAMKAACNHQTRKFGSGPHGVFRFLDNVRKAKPADRRAETETRKGRDQFRCYTFWDASNEALNRRRKEVFWETIDKARPALGRANVSVKMRELIFGCKDAGHGVMHASTQLANDNSTAHSAGS